MFAKFMKNMDPALLEQLRKTVLFEFVLPNIMPKIVAPGSTDVGDVSWVVPTNQIGTACMVSGTPAHSWQQVTQGTMSIAHKGMMVAAKVLAVSAMEFIENPEIIVQAKEELQHTLGGTEYKSPIAPEIKPHVPDWVESAMNQD